MKPYTPPLILCLAMLSSCTGAGVVSSHEFKNAIAQNNLEQQAIYESRIKTLENKISGLEAELDDINTALAAVAEASATAANAEAAPEVAFKEVTPGEVTPEATATQKVIMEEPAPAAPPLPVQSDARSADIPADVHNDAPKEERMDDGAPALPSPQGEPESVASAAEKSFSTRQEHYQAATDAYRARDYARAAHLFGRYAERYEQSGHVPAALYWQAESYYSMGQYDKAIIRFQKMASAYPEHEKTPFSLLKTAYSYRNLADKGNTRLYLLYLLEHYPDSNVAGLAQEALEEL